jgi:hypothetical protein
MLLTPTTAADSKLVTPNDGVDAKLWTIFDAAGRTATTFTMTWNRPGKTPGIKIRLNVEMVYRDTENCGGGFSPQIHPIQYVLV